MELSGIIDNDFLFKTDKDCKVLGLDTGKPVMQFGHYIFSGEYKDALGTLVFFEDVETKKQLSAFGQPQKELKFKQMTNKKLVMKRAFLEPKSKDDSSTSTVPTSPQPTASTSRQAMPDDDEADNLSLELQLNDTP